ncbi:hypothetical protein ACFX2F_003293 [Malus domestica]
MVDFHMGDELVCFSISSLVEHLEDLLILLLKDFIHHRYLVVLSLNSSTLAEEKTSFVPSFVASHQVRRGCHSACCGFLRSPC